MTRPPDLPGHYRIERELKLAMNPEPPMRPGLIVNALWMYAAFMTGIGVGLAWIVFVMLAPAFWVCRKMWGRR